MQEFLKELIVEAGAMAKGYFEVGVTRTTKSHPTDFVTEADVAVNNFIVERIKREYPDHAIHSEEIATDTNPGAEYEWVIDPIDGTRNFAHSMPLWCCMIAVLKNNETILAAVYQPVTHELFFAQKGKGATLNDKPIFVSTRPDLRYATASISRMAEAGSVYGTHIERYKDFVTRIVNDTNVWVHSFGNMTAACAVANGGLDFFTQNAGRDYDYLPSVLICEEAGAVVTDSDGNPWTRHRQDIVIANPVLHKEVMKLFR
jgi:myo-inositol-1(or 4)-monophosphatase